MCHVLSGSNLFPAEAPYHFHHEKRTHVNVQAQVLRCQAVGYMILSPDNPVIDRDPSPSVIVPRMLFLDERTISSVNTMSFPLTSHSNSTATSSIYSFGGPRMSYLSGPAISSVKRRVQSVSASFVVAATYVRPRPPLLFAPRFYTWLKADPQRCLFCLPSAFGLSAWTALSRVLLHVAQLS